MQDTCSKAKKQKISGSITTNSDQSRIRMCLRAGVWLHPEYRFCRHTLKALLWFVVLCSACTYTIKVTDGPTAHERKYYAKAIPLLEKEFAKSKTRVERGRLAYLLGDCARNIGRPEDGLKWFQIAYDNSYGPEALKALAYMYKQTEQYGEAQKAFKQLGQEIGSQYEYRKEITACAIAEDWKQKANKGEWELIPVNFNTAASEFCPTVAPDGRLVFTSDRPYSLGKAQYPWTQRPYYDLYIVEPDGASAQAFQADLNTPAHESNFCFHPNGKEAYYTRSVEAAPGADRYMRIFRTRKLEKGWTQGEELAFQRERTNYVHPALAPDGKTLYFSTTDGLWGGYDICSATLDRDSWSEPKALPRVVNTGGDDVFPVWNGDTLYFSSNGHTGMGGLDIYKTWRIGEKSWAPPVNLKSPVNSGFDDYGYCILRYTRAEAVGEVISEGYLSSNRPSGRGLDDIYRVVQRVPKPEVVPIKTDTVVQAPQPGKIILEVAVLEKIYADPNNPNSAVLGRKPLSGSALQVIIGNKPVTTEILAEGAYKRTLGVDQQLELKATADGYLAGVTRVSTQGYTLLEGQDQKIEVEIVLDRIFKGREITLENIYYDYDRAEIRQDAAPTLDALAETLNQNPTIKIQLGSHTDCRGNDRYNLELSQRRAQSAVNYLISKGIDPGRLSAVGYGEAAPVASCVCQACTEAEHQLNRRTTFRILE